MDPDTRPSGYNCSKPARRGRSCSQRLRSCPAACRRSPPSGAASRASPTRSPVFPRPPGGRRAKRSSPKARRSSPPAGSRSRQPTLPAPAAPEPLTAGLQARAVRSLAALRADGAEPRSVQALADDLGIGREETTAALAALEREGHLRRIAPDVYLEPETLAELERRGLALAAERGSISLAELRDELRTSRKYAQALIEHLDREGLTVRRGDRHLPRRAPSAGA